MSGDNLTFGYLTPCDWEQTGDVLADEPRQSPGGPSESRRAAHGALRSYRTQQGIHLLSQSLGDQRAPGEGAGIPQYEQGRRWLYTVVAPAKRFLALLAAGDVTPLLGLAQRKGSLEVAAEAVTAITHEERIPL